MIRLKLIIAISIILNACYDDSLYNESQFTFDELVDKIELEKVKLFANGKDESLVNIIFGLDSNTENARFFATLSNGVFKSNRRDTISLKPKLNVNSFGNTEKTISFKIVSSQTPGNTSLTLSLNDYIKIVDIVFERSYPSDLEILPNPKIFSRKNTGNIELIANLLSEEGSPSFKTQIDFDITDTMHNSIGELLTDCKFVNESDKCTALYSIWPDTSYVGRIIVKASTFNGVDTINEFINIYSTD